MPDWGLWAIIAVGCFIVELFTTSAIFLCFGLASIATAIAAGIVSSVQWQLAIFAVVALVLFFTGRPLLIRYFYTSRQGIKTNVEALVGKIGRVTEEIGPGLKKGRVIAGGDDWRAVSADQSPIAVGTVIMVVGVESSTLYVRAQ